jgi:hypothetical protein
MMAETTTLESWRQRMHMVAPTMFVALAGNKLYDSPLVCVIHDELTLIRNLTSIIAFKGTHLLVHSWWDYKPLPTFWKVRSIQTYLTQQFLQDFVKHTLMYTKLCMYKIFIMKDVYHTGVMKNGK